MHRFVLYPQNATDVFFSLTLLSYEVHFFSPICSLLSKNTVNNSKHGRSDHAGAEMLVLHRAWWQFSGSCSFFSPSAKR